MLNSKRSLEHWDWKSAFKCNWLKNQVHLYEKTLILLREKNDDIVSKMCLKFEEMLVYLLFTIDQKAKIEQFWLILGLPKKK